MSFFISLDDIRYQENLLFHKYNNKAIYTYEYALTLLCFECHFNIHCSQFISQISEDEWHDNFCAFTILAGSTVDFSLNKVFISTRIS